MRAINSQQRSIVGLTVSGLIWGTSDVASKLVLRDLPPTILSFCRIAIALLICRLIAHNRPRPSLRSPRVALLGVVGVAAALLLQNAGLDRISAANGSMLQGATPILIVVGAALFLGESPGGVRLTGVVTALIGIAAITLTGNNSLTHPGLGDLSVLASTACFAALVIIGRPLFARTDTIAALTSIYSWASIVLLPCAAYEWFTTRDPIVIHPTSAALIVYLGVGCSALTFYLWAYALKHIDASQAAVFDNLIPVVGIVAATIMLRERPTNWELIGAMLVVGGAWLASMTASLRREDLLVEVHTGGLPEREHA